MKQGLIIFWNRGRFSTVLMFCLLVLCVHSVKAQVTVAFQGGEPGDTWAYTTTGLGAAVASECASGPNIKSGTRSIGVGGTTGGGSCWLGGSGNGSNLLHTITFSTTSIVTSSAYTRTLTFSWGNRFPACNGTGWDSGENMTFRAYHDGVAQPQVAVANGFSNAVFSIQSNQYSWTIPPCVSDFYFVVSVNTNRNDEMLFIDDVKITAPALNPTVSQPSAVLGNTLVCQGAQHTYSVNPVAGISYNWSNLPAGASFNSVNNSVNSHSMSINWGTVAPGSYSVLVTASDACGLNPAPSQTMQVTVVPAPAALTISGPASLCPGVPITLSSSYSSNNTWSTGATTSTVLVNAAGTYTLNAPSSCGMLTATHQVSLNPVPNASITPSGPTTFCQGGSLVLTSSSANGNSWSTGATTPSVTVNTSGTYSLQVTTVCGTDASSIQVTVNPSSITPTLSASSSTTFCSGGSVILSSGHASGNAWSTGATTPTISVNTGGVYTLTVSTACATASASQTVTVLPATTASITPAGPTTFCQGGSVILNSNVTSGNSWSSGATTSSISVNTSGIYTLTVSGACGTATAIQGVTVNPLPTATISFTGTPTICPGGSITLTASGGSTYVWSTGATSSSINVTSAGTYTVQSVNGCGTATSSPVTVSELTLPTVQVSGGGNLCAGDSLLLTATGGSNFVWSTGATSAAIYVHNGGNYTVFSGNSCGTVSASALVNAISVSANPVANTMSGNAPLTVQFSNASSSNVTTWYWNFGDGSGDNSPAPQHTFVTAGTYTVTLQTSLTAGCRDTDTLLIVVLSETSAIRVPNVFTPNGDRVNDHFSIETIGISEFHLSILDRWGKTVIESDDAAKGWDGQTAGGNEAADGTYFYIILAKGVDGKDYNTQGTVNLFR